MENMPGSAGAPSPAPAFGANMLTSGRMTSPEAQPGFNRLTGTVIAPPAPPMAMPIPPPAAPVALPGQEVSTAIGNATGADKMTDAELSKGFARMEYIRSALANMTRQATPPTHDDALNALAKGVKDGIFPAAEAGQIMGGITSDPAKLPAELDHRHVVAVHQLVHLAGEMQNRAAAKSEGTS